MKLIKLIDELVDIKMSLGPLGDDINVVTIGEYGFEDEIEIRIQVPMPVRPGSDIIQPAVIIIDSAL